MTVSGRRPVSQSLSSADRDERTLELLGSTGKVEIGGLAELFAVSEMTVRRDLDRLAGAGRLRRVRGGAVAVGPEPFAERYARQSIEKDLIADKLADLVGDGGAIAMDASTTIQRLAPRIADVGHLTVLTNGPDTFFALQGVPGVTAVLTGGQLDKRTGSLVGPVAARSTTTLTLRRAFVSATAISPELGTTEQTLEDAEAKASLVDAAASVVVAIDHTKLGRHATARCLDTDRIDLLVTDLDPADARLDDYRDRCDLL
ncbi:MAG: DeoR/GlpR family DNA-binding transcription regulator [Actinomycetota bacterium]|nr:DeoR/GlpR family DNA-binding transcription regulator [Actinomycetota bacterium]